MNYRLYKYRNECRCWWHADDIIADCLNKLAILFSTYTLYCLQHTTPTILFGIFLINTYYNYFHISHSISFQRKLPNENFDIKDKISRLSLLMRRSLKEGLSKRAKWYQKTIYLHDHSHLHTEVIYFSKREHRTITFHLINNVADKLPPRSAS